MYSINHDSIDLDLAAGPKWTDPILIKFTISLNQSSYFLIYYLNPSIFQKYLKKIKTMMLEIKDTLIYYYTKVTYDINISFI